MQDRLSSLILSGALVVTLTSCASTTPSVTAAKSDRPEARVAETNSTKSLALTNIEQTLNSLHKRASAADFEGYFDLYTQDAVFMGTDRTEYWPIQEFKAYTSPLFSRGRGWTYVPSERKIHINGTTAWFEERLENSKYGEVRGTGVLISTDNGWKVAQYNLALPLPNELFDGIAQRVIDYYKTE